MGGIKDRVCRWIYRLKWKHANILLASTWGCRKMGEGTPKYIYYINMRCILVFRSRGARRACGARGEVEPVGPVEGQ